jgi:hypothetical protein
MIDRETASALAHDVGKYVARIAKNVAPAGPVPPALVPLLIKDLYELAGVRASSRLEQLAAHATDERIERARAHLMSIDALEPRVRAGEQSACVDACAHAREVEALLRDLARDAR